MKRKYDVAFYKETIAMVREYFPNCSIGADVIVGYPGETDKEFMETYSLLRELPITHFHVFPYSKRKNTVAAKMEDHVQAPVKKERVKTLINLGEEKKVEFAKTLIDLEGEVLFEREKDGNYEGYCSSYIKVSVQSDQALENQIKKVAYIESIGDRIIGQLV